MKNSEVLTIINDLIADEKGTKVSLDDKFTDANLDSLGSLVFFLGLEQQFPLFEGIPQDQQMESLDIPNLTIRDLVHKCRSSITNTSTEQ